MEFKAFYCCYSSGDEIPSSSPVSVDKEAAIAVAIGMLRDPKDFVGLIDANGTTLQFYCESAGEVWMEIPVPRDRGSYGKSIRLDQIEAEMIAMPSIFSKERIPGLKFRAW